MNKKLKEQIRTKFGGRCSYCGHELNSDWQVDHAISKQYFLHIHPVPSFNVNDLENLMPSCKECNHYKRNHCIESYDTHIGFRDYMMKFHIRLSKLPKKTKVARTENRKIYMQKIADKYGITPIIPFSGIFYFETLKQV